MELLDVLNFGNPYLVIVSGLLIGLVHAFEPDHISAVSTQLLKRKPASRIFWYKSTLNSSLRGMFWGMGHTSSILLVGVLIAGLSISISTTFFSGVEMLVGFMLVSLGIFAVLNKKFLSSEHIHPHQHGAVTHTHPHTHNESHIHNHKSYVIGCIHGLAGSGGIVVLAISTLTTFELTMSFLVLFGIGSIIGMTAASGLLGIPFALMSNLTKTTAYIRYGISAVTIGIGLFIVFDMVTILL